MKYVIKIAQTFAVTGLLLLPGCKPNDAKPVVSAAPVVIDAAAVAINKVDTTKLCNSFNKYVWLVDAARSMYVDGKLSPAKVKLLDQAEGVLKDACDRGVVTTADRLKAAEASLVAIIWPDGGAPVN